MSAHLANLFIVDFFICSILHLLTFCLWLFTFFNIFKAICSICWSQQQGALSLNHFIFCFFISFQKTMNLLNLKT